MLPFTDHSSMRESMMRDDGKTLRYGRLFELLDSLAGDIAYRHCGGRKGPLTIVTASVDSMKNFANLSIHNDIKMQGYLTYVGSSSMEVIADLIIMLPISSSCCQSHHRYLIRTYSSRSRSMCYLWTSTPVKRTRRQR